jgi:uncharacterized membrane protein YgcG
MVLFVAPQAVLAADTVRDFTSNIEVYTNGDFLVTETIVYDFGTERRRGIFRTLEAAHPQEASAWYKKRAIDIEVTNVLFDGAPATYTQSSSQGEEEIKIGDADVRITGEHTYVISYLVRGGLTYIDGQVDLYWNATGDDWVGPLDSVTVTVAPVGSELGEQQTCYTGLSGSTLGCDSVVASPESAVFTSGNVNPGEQVTIAQSLDGSVIEVNVVEHIAPLFTIIPLFLFLLLGAGTAFFKAYRFHVQHAVSNVVIAQYEPYPGVLPMYSGVVIDGSLEPADITAGIMYLAQQGFLKITKTDKKVLFLFEVTDYQITLLRSVEESPTSFHNEILSLMFSGTVSGEVTSLSALKKNTSKKKENLKTLTRLRRLMKEDLLKEGFYENAFTIDKNYVLGTILAIGAAGYMSFTVVGFVGPFMLGVVTVVSAIIIASLVHRRRTKKGYEAKQHLLGFKEFLSVTDKDRFAFHNAPEKNPEQFMEYLPYAVAFGVEDKWAEVFKDITIGSPDWYDGGATNGAFVASALTRDIGAFSSSFTASSGTSPSSGGGSSGGGAGGGGGGSW